MAVDYQCCRCGFTGAFSMICPSCGNAHVMKLRQTDLFGSNPPTSSLSGHVGQSLQSASGDDEKILPIRARSTSLRRIPTGLSTLDTALGGGFVMSASTILGGDWGSGKSTLALRIAGSIPHTLYVGTEENREQIEDRATRTHQAIGCPLLCTTKLDRIVRAVLDVQERKTGLDRLDLVVIDSFNKIEGRLIEVANDLERLCRANKIALVMVAQMVKDGSLTGPNELGHLFDTVLIIEKTQTQTREIVCEKSRFAPSPMRYPLLLSERGWIELPPREGDLEAGDRGRGRSGDIVRETFLPGT